MKIVFRNERPPSTVATSIGIVWGLITDAERLQLVTDLTPLADAEPYGDFLTHPRGHAEVWGVGSVSVPPVSRGAVCRS